MQDEKRNGENTFGVIYGSYILKILIMENRIKPINIVSAITIKNGASNTINQVASNTL